MAGFIILECLSAFGSMINVFLEYLQAHKQTREFRNAVSSKEKVIIRAFPGYEDYFKDVSNYQQWTEVVDVMSKYPINEGMVKVLNVFTEDVVDRCIHDDVEKKYIQDKFLVKKTILMNRIKTDKLVNGAH